MKIANVVLLKSVKHNYLTPWLLEDNETTEKLLDRLGNEYILIGFPVEVAFEEVDRKEQVENELFILDGEEQKLRAEFSVSIDALDRRRQELLAIEDKSSEEAAV